jgi:outer membrane protein TolC
MLRLFVLLAVLGWGAGVVAEPRSAAPLPEPLTLEDALQLSHPDRPPLLRAAAREQAARAELLSAESLSGLRVTATGRLRVVDPSYRSYDNSNNDSSASLLLRKRLYDSGYSDSLKTSAGYALEAGEWHTLQARQESRLAVMRAFFDVLLADLQFARDNEAMSIAFINADRAGDRNELGQVSDVDLLQAEAEYQEIRRQRYASEKLQLLARARLAVAMGRPDDLVSNLVRPAIQLPETDPDDFAAFWREVLQGNPELQALRAERIAAAEKLAAARAADGPVLSAEAEASMYNRMTSSTHPLGAGLVLEVPLVSGGSRDAGIARAQAALGEADAALQEARLRLLQQARELWAARGTLRADLQAYRALGDYRDLYLDRSRALYELEVKTDLGDAMTQTSEVRLKLAAALFDRAMTDARLKALTGQLLEDAK